MTAGTKLSELREELKGLQKNIRKQHKNIRKQEEMAKERETYLKQIFKALKLDCRRATTVGGVSAVLSKLEGMTSDEKTLRENAKKITALETETSKHKKACGREIYHMSTLLW